MTYTLKFRQHVLATREKENLTFAQTAVRFSIGIASLIRWSKNIYPVTKRNKPATKIDMLALEKDILERPDDCKTL